MYEQLRQKHSVDGREERREERFDNDTPARLDIYQHGSDFRLVAGSEACEVANISKHGLMVRSQVPLGRSERFRLRFHFESGNELTLHGTVRWVVPDQGSFLMGLMLEDMLGTDYLLWQNRLSKMLLNQAMSASSPSPQA